MREVGMNGPNPIKATEIIAYARAMGFAKTQTDLSEFIVLIQRQDAVWMEHMHRRSNGEQG